MSDGRVGGGLDAYGRSWTIGVIGDRVALAVSPGTAMLRFGAEQRGEFIKAWAEAERRAEAQPAAMPDAAVMKLLHHAFFTGNPGASQGDWRRYCDLIGPGVAEKYGDEEAVST